MLFDRAPVVDSQQSRKQKAALAAAALVKSGWVVGLGTGSTAKLLIDELGRRVREEDLAIVGIATSQASAQRAGLVGIPLGTLDDHPQPDLTIDGADEVDPALNLIKGRGGALLREKIVAMASRRLVIVVDDSKLVRQLGTRHPVPVEVVPFGWSVVGRRVEALGGQSQIRMIANTDQPFVTDCGHWILDCRFGPISEPAQLESELNNIPGVVENGLFIGMADQIYVGRADHVQILETSPHR